MWQSVWPYLAALLPTVLVAGFFYVLIKSMMVADRRERLAQSQFEAAQEAANSDRDSTEPPPPSK